MISIIIISNAKKVSCPFLVNFFL